MIIAPIGVSITKRLRLELRPADGEIGWEVVMHDTAKESDDNFTPAMTSVVECCECRVKLKDPSSAIADPREPNCGGIPLRHFDALARAAYLDEAAAATDKYCRADIVRKHRIFGTCACSRGIILSVHDAGLVGCLVQANLNGPVPPAPRLLEEIVRENQRQQFPTKLKRKRSGRLQPRRRPFFEGWGDDASSADEEAGKA